VRRLVRAALAELPAEYADQLTNVEFVVLHGPSRLDRKRLGLHGGSLYGVYEGTPLTRRDSSYGSVLPDRISIFWGPLVRDFPDPDALAEQVRKTVYHEIGHYFGLEESDLHDTSVE
jgi:predicted Zn-dependent protease with MMP-like domain